MPTKPVTGRDPIAFLQIVGVIACVLIVLACEYGRYKACLLKFPDAPAWTCVW